LEEGDRLVAYVVPEGAELADASALKSFLKSRLPDYMVPDGFVTLASLPRSPHGKIDRAALPALTGTETVRERLAPRNELETRLADLWAAVLNVPLVGVTDSFFELGGHSLLATRLLSRVEAELGVEVPLSALFETPTVAGVATAIGTWLPTDVTGLVEPARERLRPASDLLPLDVAQLSDAEVDALLTELLANGHGPA
jgi:acyl carrier protein